MEGGRVGGRERGREGGREGRRQWRSQGGPGGPWPPQTFVKCFFSAMNFW